MLAALIAIASEYRLTFSEESVRVAATWNQGASLDQQLQDMSRQIGLSVREVKYSRRLLKPWSMPFIVQLEDGLVGVVEGIDREGGLQVRFSGNNGLVATVAAEQLSERAVRAFLAQPLTSVPDARVDEYIKPWKRSWMWGTVFRDWLRFGDIIVASLVANVLALAGMLFTMQVYDRVIPAQSYSTLWVLFTGVCTAFLFEFLMRLMRTHISDVIGKRADLRISDRVFGHALRIRNGERSKSTASFISQIRELEQVRELMTSTTISAVVDLPFFFLFVTIVWFIGGPLVCVLLAAIPLLLIPGLVLQRPLARLASEGQRESAVRNATLIESVENIEDIKLLRAEQRFQNQWNHANLVSADISKRQRFYVGLLMTWTQQLQSIVYVSVVLVGAYFVINGDMTTGALVGTSILSSRTIAPLAQISGVLSRWQQAKVARKGLDEVMRKPVDQPERGHAVHKAVIHGKYELSSVKFWYDDERQVPDIEIDKLNIQAGERIAILGRNGAGKSTLLQLLAGIQLPRAGQVLIDDVGIDCMDTADLRRDLGFLHQGTRLFFGTLRENLTLGRPDATDEEIHRALVLGGALTTVQKQGGLDYMILEGGRGLSGGQRQSLLLSRLLLCNPNIVLLDEPTAALDDVSERQVVNQLKSWLGHRTLIVATHRPVILELVDRIIVVNNGHIVADGKRDEVISKLSKGGKKTQEAQKWAANQ